MGEPEHLVSFEPLLGGLLRRRMTPLMIDAARPCRHASGDRWFVDETYVKVAGRWIYLYRAVDQFVQVIDVLVAEKRDSPNWPSPSERYKTAVDRRYPPDKRNSVPGRAATPHTPVAPRVERNTSHEALHHRHRR